MTTGAISRVEKTPLSPMSRMLSDAPLGDLPPHTVSMLQDEENRQPTLYSGATFHPVPAHRKHSLLATAFLLRHRPPSHENAHTW